MEKNLELNLIRSRLNFIETRRLYARYSRIIYFVALITFTLISFKFITIYGGISRSKKELAGLESALALKRDQFGLNDMEKEWRAYCVKLKIVDSMVSARSEWSARLKEFANLLPPGMCIQRVEVAYEEGKKNFNVVVLSLPNEQKGFRDVEGFIATLEFNPLFGKGVKLESHERRQMNGKDIEIFKISLPQEGIK